MAKGERDLHGGFDSRFDRGVVQKVNLGPALQMIADNETVAPSSAAVKDRRHIAPHLRSKQGEQAQRAVEASKVGRDSGPMPALDQATITARRLAEERRDQESGADRLRRALSEKGK